MGQLTVAPVRSERAGGCTTITLARVGRANALTCEMVDLLLAELDAAEQSGSPVVVFRSSEPQFCAGLDLTQTSSPELALRFLRIGLLLERVQRSPLVAVAVVDGPAVGAGADLVAACDVRIGTDGSTFRFPGSAFGVVLGTRRLAALVGPSTAVRLAATGSRVDALEAVRLGLLDRVVPAGDLDEAVAALVEQLSHRDGAVVVGLKQAVSSADPAGLGDLARSLAVVEDLARSMSKFAHRRGSPPA